jgi:phosphoadenosine phosphosulfate reductase
MRKVEPLARALTDFDAWVTGVRRSQAATRQSVRVVEWDARHGNVKVNPLARWSKEDVWDFIHEHDIPYNPLHDVGYPSIGCAPCTRPVLEGEDERAGRWSGFDKTECGIHLAHFAPRPAFIKD